MRKPIVSVGLVALALFPFATPAAQEQAPPPEPGTRVRVTAPALGIEGQEATFEALRGDTLVVEADTALQCALGSVTRFEVHRGEIAHTGKGLWIGGLTGFAAGVLLGPATVECCVTCDCGEEKLKRGVIGGAIGLGVGMVAGAVVGTLMKTDRWEEVPLDQLHVSFVPGRDGFALGISVAF
jgi:hypothetical protein